MTVNPALIYTCNTKEMECHNRGLDIALPAYWAVVSGTTDSHLCPVHSGLVPPPPTPTV